MATLTRIDGFEHGTWSAAGAGLYDGLFGTGTVTLESSAARSGGYGLKVVTSANTGYASINTASSQTVLVACGYFRFPSLPSADHEFFEHAFDYTGPATAYARFGLDSSNRVWADFYDSGTQGLQTRTGAISANTWYRIEWRATITGTTWTIDWQVGEADGTATAQTQVSYAKGVAGIQFTGTQIGSMDTASTTIHLDDFALSHTSGDYPIGPVKILGYSPSGVGTHNLDNATSLHFFKNDGSDTALTTAESTSWQVIDDVPLSGGTDYIFVQPRSGPTEPTNTWYTEYSFANTGEATAPLAVRALTAFLNSAAGVSSSEAWIQESGSGIQVWTGDIASTTRVYKSYLTTTKPSSGPWTLSALNALTLQFGFSNDATPNPRLHAAMIEAAFVPSGQTLLPDADTAAGGWGVTGAATRWQATSDSSDSTYMMGTAS